MLSSFSIRNFRSIVDLTIDLTYGEGKAPNGYQDAEIMPFLDSPTGERLVPCLSFFGANASGKSNILMALLAFKNIIAQAVPLAARFYPNQLNRKYTDTTLAIKFVLEDNTYEYSFSYDGTRILSEILKKDKIILFEIKNLAASFSASLVTQNYPPEKLTDILSVECSDGQGRQIKPFLNIIGNAYQGLSKDIKAVFDYINNRMRILGTGLGAMTLPLAVNHLAVACGGDKKAALSEIVSIVRKLDIDILGAGIDLMPLPPAPPAPPGARTLELRFPTLSGMIEKDESGKEYMPVAYSEHKDMSGNTVRFDFQGQESAGTQRLAGLVGTLLYALKTGGVIFVDELDCSLHSLLIRELVMLFKKRIHNRNRAQLVFTTHNTDILDDSILRLSEIALVRKNLDNGTMMRRLVDLKKDGEDIRNVTNFRKQYLEGFYSSIPHPAI